MAQLSGRSSVLRLAVSRLVSVTGSAAAYTALMATIYERTHHSAGWLSATLLLTFGVEGLVGPLAGHLSDRFDRRRVMIASELVGAAAFAAMALSHAPGILVAFACLSAIADQPFYAASAAAIPNLVDDERQIAWANSWVGIGSNGGIMLGPVLGGLLAQSIGSGWVFAGNAVTFLISVGLVWSVRRPFSQARSAQDDEHRGIVAGFRFIRRDALLRRMLIADAVMVIGLGMGMVADRPLAEHFGVGDAGFGLLISCWGLGSVVGSFLGRRLGESSEQRWLVLGVAGLGVTGLGMGLAPVFWPILLFILANGVADALAIVADQGIKQRRTPDAVRGRVLSASDAVVHVTLAGGYVLAGPLLAATGAQGLYVAAGVTASLAAVVLFPLYGARVVAAPAVAPDVELS
jgi:MFS family permease